MIELIQAFLAPAVMISAGSLICLAPFARFTAVIGQLRGLQRESLAALRREAKAFEKVFGKSGRALSKSYKDHAADDGQAQAILDDLNAEWKSAQQRVLDLRFELRDSVTEEEWAALFTNQ